MTFHNYILGLYVFANELENNLREIVNQIIIIEVTTKYKEFVCIELIASLSITPIFILLLSLINSRNTKEEMIKMPLFNFSVSKIKCDGKTLLNKW